MPQRGGEDARRVGFEKSVGRNDEGGFETGRREALLSIEGVEHLLPSHRWGVRYQTLLRTESRWSGLSGAGLSAIKLGRTARCTYVGYHTLSTLSTCY